jgi:hypothetical protein
MGIDPRHTVLSAISMLSPAQGHTSHINKKLFDLLWEYDIFANALLRLPPLALVDCGLARQKAMPL